MHFLVLGGLIFLVTPSPKAERTIRISGAALSAQRAAQARRLGVVALSEEQAREVMVRAVEDELLYREARRLSLDQDDIIVRQRLIQKALFLAETLAGASRPPTEEELRAFFTTTKERWVRPARVRFLHVFASPDHKDSLPALLSAADAATTAHPGVPPVLGEPFPMSRMVDLHADALATQYGAEFAEAVLRLPISSFCGPIPSRFGWHLVQVLLHEDGGPATFEEVRDRLPLLYTLSRKRQASRDFLREALAGYRVEVDGLPLRELPESGRVAAVPGSD